MPAQPAYFHRLEEAIAAFRGMPSSWIDRRTVEEVLGVSKTVAWRILRGCGATDGPGKTLVCGREELVRRLEQLQQTGSFEREIRRRNRVEEYLQKLAQIAHTKTVKIASESRALELVSSRFKKLPAGVELTPSRLTIEFHGTEEFLEKVGALVFALQNDYEAVREFIEETPKGRNQ